LHKTIISSAGGLKAAVVERSPPLLTEFTPHEISPLQPAKARASGRNAGGRERLPGIFLALLLVSALLATGCTAASPASPTGTKIAMKRFDESYLPTGGNLLKSGNFDDFGSRDLACEVGETIGAWRVTAGKPLHAWARVPQLQASQGMTCCHLGYGSQQATLSQPFSAVRGGEYQLSFLLHNLKADDGTVHVDVRSAGDPGKVFLSQDFGGDDTWTLKTATFTAGAAACVIEFTNTSGSAMSLDSVVLVNTALSIFESEGITSVNEVNETLDTIAIALGKPPAATVRISLRPGTDDIKLNDASPGKYVDLVFTPGNWNRPQPVRIKAVDDSEIAEGVERIAVSISAKTDDAFYSMLDYSDLEIDVEVVDAATRYYGDFMVFANCQTTPFVLEKATHISPCGTGWEIDGTINTPTWLAAYVRKAHRYGARAIIQINNTGAECESSVHACFDQLCDNADGSRNNFVRSAVRYVEKNNLDGLQFDIEWSTSQPPWVNYNILLDELRSAVGPSVYIGSDVYSGRGELNSTGMAAVDSICLMSYDGWSDVTGHVGYWRNRGAPDNKLLPGMYPYDKDLAYAAKVTRYALDEGMAGVMLFGFDTEQQATSTIQAVRDTLIAHYLENKAKRDK
jgi:hypothetical protein